MAITSCSTDCTNVSLTIYNNSLGLVREVRTVNLTPEDSEIVFTDLADSIDRLSFFIQGVSVLEYNYSDDLYIRQELLEKYVGKNIYLPDKTTGKKRSFRVLTTKVFEDNDTKEICIDDYGNREIIFPHLPDDVLLDLGFICKIVPTTVENVKIYYLCKGLEWSVRYIIEIFESTLNIIGWAVILNHRRLKAAGLGWRLKPPEARLL